jgi:hypothetical protein
MSEKKKNNSLIFLTTLSVYLGLVLVGANSPVLAQAALARNFDIHEEIEFKDDLDKKPDDESCSELSETTDRQLRQFGFRSWAAIDFANLIDGPVTDLVVPGSESNFSKNGYAFFDHLFSKSKSAGFEPSLIFNIAPEGSASTYSFSYSLETPADAYLPASALDSDFKFANCIAKGETGKIIYTNAGISHSNNQVTVVTRLPRASIDSLLARTNAS